MPFTTEQFFKVFENYNFSVFPFQLIFVIFGLGCLLLLHSRNSNKNKLIGSFLGLMWIWIGIVYHIVFFSLINKAAYIFGFFFVTQGILIIIYTFGKNKILYNFKPLTQDYFGYFFILFGLIFYPIIGYISEGSFSRIIALGLPCPTTILTFGFFLMAKETFPKYLMIIPSLWSIIGTSAAINFGVHQDVMLIITAIIANILLLLKKKDTEIKPFVNGKR